MKRGTGKTAPEPTRRKFDGDWDQVLYYYYKFFTGFIRFETGQELLSFAARLSLF
jgi:hypothetical protein